MVLIESLAAGGIRSRVHLREEGMFPDVWWALIPRSSIASRTIHWALIYLFDPSRPYDPV